MQPTNYPDQSTVGSRTFLSMQENDIRLRRIRLISDIMEDYQDNINRTIRLIEQEAGFERDPPSASHQTDREPRRYYAFPTNGDLRFNNREFGGNRVVGGLTTEQILQFTTPVPYEASMNDTRCPITWEPFTPGQELLRVNVCNHIFSRNAIIEWFGRNRHCPVCRSNPVAHMASRSTQQNYPTYNVLGYSALVSLEPLDTNPTDSTRMDVSGDSVTDSYLPNSEDRQTRLNDIRRSARPFDGSSEQTATASTRQQSTNFVNTLLRGLVSNLNEAVNSNTDYYEREFTLNINDLLNLSADALVNEVSRAATATRQTGGDAEYNDLPQ